MKSPLAITACHLLTPLDTPGGLTTWQALRAAHRVPGNTEARVHDSFLQGNPSWDRSIRIAVACGMGILPRPCLPSGGTPSHAATGLFCGTSKGPITTMLAACDFLRKRERIPEAIAQQVALGTGAMGTLVAQALGLASGHTSIAACSSGMFALHRAAQALWRGECQKALIVAADASLHPLFEGSFARLGVLAPINEAGVRTCEPFSEAGKGFFVSEAAAAVLLEIPTPSTTPTAWLDDCWIGADATGLVAIDPSTATLRHGLSFLHPNEPLAFIHAHATGTTHDRYEMEALRAAFCHTPKVPIFSSKKWLGHSLGAAGLVSTCLSILSHQHSALPTGEPISKNASSLTIAQGFGGHIAVVKLRGAK